MMPLVLLDGKAVSGFEILIVETIRDANEFDTATVTVRMPAGAIPYMLKQTAQITLTANDGLVFSGKVSGVEPSRDPTRIKIRCRSLTRNTPNYVASSDRSLIDSISRAEEFGNGLYLTINMSQETVRVLYDVYQTKEVPLDWGTFVGQIFGVRRRYTPMQAPEVNLKLYASDLRSPGPKFR